MKILIVEDSNNDRLFLFELLKSCSYDVSDTGISIKEVCGTARRIINDKNTCS